MGKIIVLLGKSLVRENFSQEKFDKKDREIIARKIRGNGLVKVKKIVERFWLGIKKSGKIFCRGKF